MIKFFRNIRKKLLAEGSTTKYFKYALGEIVLVVVGILIALQINTWNEQNKLKKEEFSYLERLKYDLEADLKYFDIQIQEGESSIKRNQQFIIDLQKKQNNLEEVVSLLENFQSRTERLLMQNSTFEELKSSGKLRLIENKILRSQIVDFYRVSHHAIKMMDDYNDYTLSLLGSVEFNLFKFKAYKKKSSVYTNDSFYHPTDWAFFNDPASSEYKQVENLVTQYAGKHKQEQEFCGKIISDIKKLIVEIDKELKLFK